MSAGSVTVAADGTVTKSGLAGAIYDARVASLALVVPPGIIPDGPSGYAIKHGLALDANALASAFYTSSGIVPSGTLVAYAGAAAPTGWLLCDGSAVSRTTYADLFAVCSTTYGIGDGATTFNLPDLRGRAAIGSGTGDASDATAHALGSKTGTETVTLDTTQIPSHAHSITDPGHKHPDDVANEGFVVSHAGLGTLAIGAGTDYEVATLTGSNTTGITTGNLGGGNAHNNMPPVLTVNWIIKT